MHARPCSRGFEGSAVCQVNHSRKDIDVLFYGWVLPGSHREQMIQALEGRGLPVKVPNVAAQLKPCRGRARLRPNFFMQ